MAIDLPPQTEIVTLADTRLEQSVSISADGFTQFRVVGKHVMPSLDLPVVTADDETQFRQLADVWIKETGPLSDPISKYMHPSHLKIIGMGIKVLPLILREVEIMSGHWFVALDAVSPVNPVTPQDERSLDRITEAWLAWGRTEELI
jgi:hypothetical protein